MNLTFNFLDDFCEEDLFDNCQYSYYGRIGMSNVKNTDEAIDKRLSSMVVLSVITDRYVGKTLFRERKPRFSTY